MDARVQEAEIGAGRARRRHLRPAVLRVAGRHLHQQQSPVVGLIWVAFGGAVRGPAGGSGRGGGILRVFWWDRGRGRPIFSAGTRPPGSRPGDTTSSTKIYRWGRRQLRGAKLTRLDSAWWPWSRSRSSAAQPRRRPRRSGRSSRRGRRPADSWVLSRRTLRTRQRRGHGKAEVQEFLFFAETKCMLPKWRGYGKWPSACTCKS